MKLCQEILCQEIFTRTLLELKEPMLIQVTELSKSIRMIVILVLAVILLISTDLFTDVSSQTSSSDLFSSPSIEWQKIYFHAGSYGDTGIQSVSNLIQTSDGGYIFMDLGWTYNIAFQPSTIYKVDSSGNTQWNKTIDNLSASVIIQTSDEGYEIAGQWTVGVTYQYTPTLVKLDSQGNIQWIANYSSVPNLGATTSNWIRTSDAGYAYRKGGSIIKTDFKNITQWVETFNYTESSGRLNPLSLFSLIETSDGSLAALGVGTYWSGNPRTGRIYLIKTEAFLPLPYQAPLPTPMPTFLPTPTDYVIPLVFIALGVVAVACLLVFLKKRESISL